MFGLKVFVFASIVAFSSATISPCPDKFTYESEGKGVWKGTLRVSNEYDLHGLWIRVVLDNKYSSIIIDDDSLEVVSSDDNEALLRNRNLLLKANVVKDIPITVKYEGTTPKLVGFRVNAKVVCPPPANRSPDYYFNNKNSEEFLKSVTIKTPPKLSNECGKPRQGDKQSDNPWTARLTFVAKPEEVVCEGTLVSPNHIITAAHCVTYRESSEKVPEHLWQVQFSSVTSKVKKITIHPGYQSAGLLNDIAVVQLEKPLEISEELEPICLGESDDAEYKRGHIQDGKLGETRTSEVQEINGDECVNRIPELAGLIADNAVCATYVKDEPQCTGQSGSGLISLNGNRLELRGVLTVGADLQKNAKCNPSTTIVLVRVTRYLKWIRSIIS